MHFYHWSSCFADPRQGQVCGRGRKHFLNTGSFSYFSHHSPLSLIIMSSCIQCCSSLPSAHLQPAGLRRRDHGLYAIPSFLIRGTPALVWPSNLYKPLCKRRDNQTGWPISHEIHLFQHVFSPIWGTFTLPVISTTVETHCVTPRQPCWLEMKWRWRCG